MCVTGSPQDPNLPMVFPCSNGEPGKINLPTRVEEEEWEKEYDLELNLEV